jgi:hypothetical protein
MLIFSVWSKEEKNMSFLVRQWKNVGYIELGFCHVPKIDIIVKFCFILTHNNIIFESKIVIFGRKSYRTKL